MIIVARAYTHRSLIGVKCDCEMGGRRRREAWRMTPHTRGRSNIADCFCSNPRKGKFLWYHTYYGTLTHKWDTQKIMRIESDQRPDGSRRKKNDKARIRGGGNCRQPLIATTTPPLFHLAKQLRCLLTWKHSDGGPMLCCIAMEKKPHGPTTSPRRRGALNRKRHLTRRKASRERHQSAVTPPLGLPSNTSRRLFRNRK